jgi:uncharacterized protein YegL
VTAPVFPPTQTARSRLLITLVLDTSQSMQDSGGIVELNSALKAWRHDLRQRDAIRRIGEIALVTFGQGGVRVVDPSGRPGPADTRPFVPIDDYNPPDLTAGGLSPMENALHRALSITDGRREQLRAEGVGKAYRHLVFLITDGAPSDEIGRPSETWQQLAPELRRRTSSSGEDRILFAGFAVKGADRALLERLAPGCIHDATSESFTEVLDAVMDSIERSMKNRGDVDVPGEVEKFRRIRDWIRGQGDA